MKEEWRDVLGWEDYYQASNLGRIKAKARKYWKPDPHMKDGGCWQFRKERFKKITKHARSAHPGYYSCQVGFCVLPEKKQKIYDVHRIIWEAFNGPIIEGYQIDHIDSDPTNNRLDNLQCLTPLEHRKVTLERIHNITIKDQYWNQKDKLFNRGISVHLSKAYEEGYKQALIDYNIKE